MKYKDYTADDLIKDEFFQQWVFAPTEESNRFWIDFLDHHPQHRERVEEARQFLSFFHVKDKDVFESRISNLKKRITESIDNPTPESVTETIVEKQNAASKINWKRWRRFANAIVMFVFGVVALVYAFSNKHAPEVVSSSPETGMQTCSTARGKRSVINLPDGTSVWLNADSKIIFPKTFDDQKTREVTLEGEAYFEVAENLQKPFVVNVVDLEVGGVAGKFNINAYDDRATVAVTLVDGKVTAEVEDQPVNKIALSPSQRVVYEKKSGNFAVDNRIDTEVFTGWRNGAIAFQEETFADIKSVLERWYNVTIKVDDEHALQCRFSARFDNKTLQEVLDMFAQSGNAHYQIVNNTVTFYGDFCPGDKQLTVL